MKDVYRTGYDNLGSSVSRMMSLAEARLFYSETSTKKFEEKNHD